MSNNEFESFIEPYKKAARHARKFMVLDNKFIGVSPFDEMMYIIDIPSTGMSIAFDSNSTNHNPVIYYELYDKVTKYSNYSGKLLIQEQDIKEDENFSKLLKYKVGDGIGWHRWDHPCTVIIPYFATLLSINKNDTAMVSIYEDTNDTNAYIVIYTVSKKNIKTTMNVVMRIAKLV